MKLRIFALILFAVSLNGFGQTAGNGEKFRPESCAGVYILVPEGFARIADTAQPGFLHQGSATTIIVRKIQGSAFVRNYYTPEAMSKNDGRVQKMESIMLEGGKEAVLYTFAYTLRDTKTGQDYEFERLMLFTGNQDFTCCIIATYPIIVKKLIFDPVYQSITSVSF